MLTKTLSYIRIALFATLIFLGLYIYQIWEKEHPVLIEPTSTPHAINNDIPIAQASNLSIPVDVATQSVPAAPVAPLISMIIVKTDTLEVMIDRQGGNIVQTKLLDYPDTLHSSQPYLLLNNIEATKYIAQSGLISPSGPDSPDEQAMFSSDSDHYTLTNDQKELIVNLKWKNSEGLLVTKTFTFHRNSYVIDLQYKIDNQTPSVFQGNVYLQLARKDNPPPSHQGFMSLATYFGAAISSPDKKFQKIAYSDMNSTSLDKSITGGWGAMVQHYFVSAWVPENNVPMQYFTRVNNGLYRLGMVSPPLIVQPGKSIETQAKFYTGPSIATDLAQASPTLPLTIDYGWFWFISDIIFWMMQQIYNLVGNWGWSIVLVTIIIKLLFYQLSAKSYRSMSGLKQLQPKLNQLKERYGSDKQKFTQATIELYKKEKVNPMSGCLPILVQIPVFIGLYWVLIESVQLRQAPWILWIQDLSTKDPYYILPVLMGLSMFLQQRLNPPPPDPVQAKVMMMLPIVFTVLFINFPAGLMLYWFVNNTLSFLQQWYIMRGLGKNEKIKKLNN